MKMTAAGAAANNRSHEAIQRKRDHDWIGNGASLNIVPLYVGDGIFEQGQRPTNEAISSPLSCKDKTLD